MKMKGIKIGVIVEKKHCDGNQESSNGNQELRNGEPQALSKSEGIYVNDPVSHKNFVKNIFSIFAT